MPDWLKDATAGETIPPGTMAARIALAVLLGAIVAAIYRLSHGRGARDAGTLTTTIVLLTALLAMVSMVIGDSVARAFGLVGALSIVRFRTVVEDTRDTAFVIFAVIVGMAVGTGLLVVAFVGVPIVGTAALVLQAATRVDRSAASRRRRLTVRMSIGHDPAIVLEAVRSRAPAVRLRSMPGVRTTRQGSGVELLLDVDAADADVPGLVLSLNGLEGVTDVSLAAPDASARD